MSKAVLTQPKVIHKIMQPTITNTQINSALSFTQMFAMASPQIALCSKDLPKRQCSMFRACYNHSELSRRQTLPQKSDVYGLRYISHKLRS
jgi:hypothetical protein